MDVFKKTTEKLRGNSESNELNARRIAEDYPKIESKSDQLILNDKFKMEFVTSAHHHTIKLNLHLKPPVNCFQCNVGNPVDEIESIAVNATAGAEDGEQHIVTFANFSSNTGDFILGPPGSVIVPKSGVYNFFFNINVSGVTVSSIASVVASTRVGEAVVQQRVWSVSRGSFTGGQFINIDVALSALCMPMAQGDTFSAFLGAAGIAFLNSTAGSIKTTLIALA